MEETLGTADQVSDFIDRKTGDQSLVTYSK